MGRGGLDSGIGTFTHIDSSVPKTKWNRKSWEKRALAREKKARFRELFEQIKNELIPQAFCTVCGKLFDLPNDRSPNERAKIRRCPTCVQNDLHASEKKFCLHCGKAQAKSAMKPGERASWGACGSCKKHIFARVNKMAKAEARRRLAEEYKEEKRNG
ncbi:MAG: hypothetical protein AUJ71_01250 [Candidatus Omnitrophica bacterium CG1_02_49_16]|nr:MAG: hypothetical protein AUJ71_01250 [Candidatus Omnitrophica bacterium CG1_02_49_16]